MTKNRAQTNAIFELILAETKNKSALNVLELCELAGVSRSGYYRWIAAADKRIAREAADYADFLLIQKAYNFRGYTKGSRGVCMRLRRMGIKMNRKKVQRLMRKFHLFCPVRRANPHRRMAKALQTNTIAPNYVNRQFRTHGPRKVLLTDITYLRLHQKHVYLSVIKDAYTKQILAYQLSESLEVDFVLDTKWTQQFGSIQIRDVIIQVLHSDSFWKIMICANLCPGVETVGIMRHRKVSLVI